MRMRFFLFMGLLRFFLSALIWCVVSASDFFLAGDYVLSGLFDIHEADADESVYLSRPEAIDCSSHRFSLSSYRRLQLMRFSIEEINNSTSLLPNVSLGYELFDLCSDTKNFPVILDLISVKGLIAPWNRADANLTHIPKALAVVGPFTTTIALAVVPLFMPERIPVVSYGAASTTFSRKDRFPSFLRTVHSNKETIDVVVRILQHYNWIWFAFLYSDNDYGMNGLELLMKKIESTNICLAYTKGLTVHSDYPQIFKQIQAQRINLIVAFTTDVVAETLVESAIRLDIPKKVWLAVDTWSLNKKLLKMEGIQNIGTVLGVSQPVVPIPGFSEFLHFVKSRTVCESITPHVFCNQDYNCSRLNWETLLSMDPSFSFPVYSAVYAIAHALHKILQCGPNQCNRSISVLPRKVLEELKKSNFTLLNTSVQFNNNGDPKFGSYSIVFWNQTGDAQEVGSYHFFPSISFFINSTGIQWHTENKVPSSRCSSECPEGYARRQTGHHTCCFKCEICSRGYYINSTDDPYRCVSCKEAEWSAEGSTSCNLRLVEYVQFKDFDAIVIMTATLMLVCMTIVVSVLFIVNLNTPIVRSAGGPMCFLILGCLSLSSLSVFFYFGKPTHASCVMRYLPFLLFYTICLACFVVRSFQIVCIFKISAQFPKLNIWWTEYHGQWLLINVAFGIQIVLVALGYHSVPPYPNKNTAAYHDKIILGCEFSSSATSTSVIMPLFLCFLSFIFSYMGKDLPKNYNEAKAITFCLLLLIFTWILFATTFLLYQGKHIYSFNALAVLSSLYSFLLWYFLPKCYIIIFQPHRNTQQYFQGLIQSYTKTLSK